MGAATAVFVLFNNYLVPALFVIGLVFFMYGIIQYFIIGQNSGDEERKQVGRDNLLRATSWFAVALFVFSVISFIGWLGSSLSSIDQRDGSIDVDATTGGDIDAGVRINESRATLPVPNAPRENIDRE